MGLLSPAKDESVALSPYVSPWAAWAISLGTSIGWGSFVITSNNYLLQAGPLGSVLGMLIGAAIMLVIARNYAYLMNKYSESSGVYAFAKHAFGHDYGFLAAWFIGIVYLAVLWANATSLPLFARYFLGDMFRFGYLYTLFGYDVYLGEALLSIAALVTFGLLCICWKKLTARVMVVLAVVFVGGIAVCFGAAMMGAHAHGQSFDPAFLPNRSTVMQVVMIACITPWAFIGFENISHSTPEFTFDRRHSHKVLVASVIATTALYIFVVLLSVTAYPPQFDSWLEYLGNLDSLAGIEGLPGFYAAHHYLGDTGVNLLIATLFALIASSLFGNIIALSRLFHGLASDGVLHRSLSALNDKGIPFRSVLCIVAISCIVPFLGRTAIGWIVDVTTIGASITYGFVSAAALKTARSNNDLHETVTGVAGLVFMAIILAVLLLPSLFTVSSMAIESYFFFVIWSLLGLLYFRYIMAHDPDNRFGESVVVWIALLAFIMFMSFVWMEGASEQVAEGALSDMRAYYEQVGSSPHALQGAEALFAHEEEVVHQANTRNTLIVLALFAISLGVLISNYSYMKRRERQTVLQLGVERIRANTDPLTNVKNKHAYSEKEFDLNQRIGNGTVDRFAIVVCDLNGLKTVNDTLGHEAGDDFIRNACKIVCDTFKRSPVYRIGGDEFVVVVDGYDYDQRESLLGSLNEVAQENVLTGGSVIAAGMATFDAETDRDVLAVFQRADARMYEQKALLKASR